jgi:hypothetical protein
VTNPWKTLISKSVEMIHGENRLRNLQQIYRSVISPSPAVDSPHWALVTDHDWFILISSVTKFGVRGTDDVVNRMQPTSPAGYGTAPTTTGTRLAGRNDPNAATLVRRITKTGHAEFDLCRENLVLIESRHTSRLVQRKNNDMKYMWVCWNLHENNLPIPVFKAFF